jgi:hypothetical protein
MKTKMKAAQRGKPGRDFELMERDLPQPGARQGCLWKREKNPCRSVYEVASLLLGALCSSKLDHVLELGGREIERN